MEKKERQSNENLLVFPAFLDKVIMYPSENDHAEQRKFIILGNQALCSEWLVRIGDEKEKHTVKNGEPPSEIAVRI